MAGYLATLLAGVSYSAVVGNTPLPFELRMEFDMLDWALLPLWVTTLFVWTWIRDKLRAGFGSELVLFVLIPAAAAVPKSLEDTNAYGFAYIVDHTREAIVAAVTTITALVMARLLIGAPLAVRLRQPAYVRGTH